MKKEIERKFLVERTKLLSLKLHNGLAISTGYFCENPEIRVRAVGKKAFITFKTSGLISREEYEYEIPLREAKNLLLLTELKIEKIRYKFPLNGHTWEIDFYEGANQGLIVAEVELTRESDTVTKPLWLGREVTEELRFRNQNLAKKPFSSWR